MADEEEVFDEVTEETTEGYGSRLSNSFSGICFGLLLFFGSGVTLFWNEGVAAKRYVALKQGSKLAMEVKNNVVLPENEGKLVVISGTATTEDTLIDPDFGFQSSKTLQLRRVAEMYQWSEKKNTKTEKKTGGSKTTITTYTYEKKWSQVLINSDKFNKSYGHINPDVMKYESSTWTAAKVTLGAFNLPSSEVLRINTWTDTHVSDSNNTTLLSGVKPSGTGYYVGENPSSPQVGDIRVTFSVVLPTDITIVAQQSEGTFVPFVTNNGGSIDLLKTGIYGKELMFSAANKENKIATWAIRVIGILAMYFGMSLILDPIVVLSDVLPFLGTIAEIGVSLISWVVAIVTSFVVIAVAWIFYRPVVAYVLLGVSALLLAVPCFLKKKGSKTASEDPTESTQLLA
eukprot:5537164-Ditylum_brightwellii.AAC.1